MTMRCSTLLAVVLLIAAASATSAQTCPSASQAATQIRLNSGSMVPSVSTRSCGSGFSLLSLYVNVISGALSANVTQSTSGTTSGIVLAQSNLFSANSQCYSSSVPMPLVSAASNTNYYGYINFYCASSNGCEFRYNATFGCTTSFPIGSDSSPNGVVSVFSSPSACNNPSSGVGAEFYNGACTTVSGRSVKVQCSGGTFSLSTFADPLCSLGQKNLGTFSSGQCVPDNNGGASYIVACTGAAMGVVPMLSLLAALAVAALFGKNTL